MKIQTARKLLTEDLNSMSLEALQAHKVRLTDAARESEAEYGFPQAVKDGFYTLFAEPGYEPGFVHADLWLTHNLWERVNEARILEEKLFRKAQ